jgi:hypothetical protein
MACVGTDRELQKLLCWSGLTIAKLWKQPRCPTTDEWIKKMWEK